LSMHREKSFRQSVLILMNTATMDGQRWSR